MLQNNAFELDLDVLVAELLPTDLRKPKHIAWLKFLVRPFKKQLRILKIHRLETIEKLTHTSQVGSMEKVLNTHFDVIDRRIRIRPGHISSQTYIYKEVEQRPLYTPFFLEGGNENADYSNPLATYLVEYTPFWIYTENEVANSYVDFVVYVPLVLALTGYDLIRLEAMVRYYCLDDKTFRIDII